MEVIEPATLMSKCHDPIRLTTATRPISQKYLLSSVNFMKSPRTCDSRCTPWIEGRPIIDINTRCLIVAFHCYNDRNRLCWWTDTRNNTTLFHLSHWLPVAHRVTAIESETPGFYPLRIMSLHHLFYCSVAQPVFRVLAGRWEPLILLGGKPSDKVTQGVQPRSGWTFSWGTNRSGKYFCCDSTRRIISRSSIRQRPMAPWMRAVVCSTDSLSPVISVTFVRTMHPQLHASTVNRYFIPYWSSDCVRKLTGFGQEYQRNSYFPSRPHYAH